jgi:elongation factor G
MQDIKLIRNVAILGHGQCGKTTLAEALLFTAGETNRQGKVDDGSSVMDYEPEEVKKKITISASFNKYTWKKHDVFLIDTPGDDNFITESKFASQVADSAIFCIGASVGVKNQTYKFIDFIKERNLPTIIYIARMDRERANFANVLNSLKESVDMNGAVVYLPIGAEADFKGLVDIINNKALICDTNGKATEADIPADIADDAAMYREQLMELVAETDDDLIEKFLEEGELTDEDLMKGLRAAVAKGEIYPVCAGAALNNMGTSMLMDMINDLLPAPCDLQPCTGTDPKTGDLIERKPTVDEPFSAQVFKTISDPYTGRLNIFKVKSGTLSGDSFYNSSKETTERFGQLFIMKGKEQKPVDSVCAGMIAAVAKLKETVTGDTLCDEKNPIVYDALVPADPVMSFAVSAKKGDEEKLFASITKMLDEDLTLRLTREDQTNEILIGGVGQVHLEVVGQKIKRKFGVEMELRLPKIPYKETIKKKVEVQYKHKKQSGGRGQYAENYLEISPLPPNSGFEFEDRIVGGVIPKTYIPAVEKGVVEAMANGILAGYPVVDLKVAVFDGSFHAVDSSEMAFKIAGSMAFKKGALQANPVLLEPVMNVTVEVPEDCVGDIMGDLNSRRGRVMGMDSGARNEIISAQVPMAEMQSYAADLTSITAGRGVFTVELSHYEEVPAQIAEKIIEESNKEE